MKIALLNGSPKYKNSSSEILLADLKSCILEAAKTAEDACRETDILEITLHHDNVPPEIIQKLESADYQETPGNGRPDASPGSIGKSLCFRCLSTFSIQNGGADGMASANQGERQKGEGFVIKFLSLLRKSKRLICYGKIPFMKIPVFPVHTLLSGSAPGTATGHRPLSGGSASPIVFSSAQIRAHAQTGSFRVPR